MEEQIQQAIRKLRMSYIIFWVFPFLLFIIGNLELVPIGRFADNGMVSYTLETIGILLTAACVPLALKLFSLVLRKKIDLMSIELALKRYVQWSIFRLILLELVVVLNLISYFLLLSDTGGLCMLIGLLASLFCIPSDAKLRTELRIIKE